MPLYQGKYNVILKFLFEQFLYHWCVYNVKRAQQSILGKKKVHNTKGLCKDDPKERRLKNGGNMNLIEQSPDRDLKKKR